MLCVSDIILEPVIAQRDNVSGGKIKSTPTSFKIAADKKDKYLTAYYKVEMMHTQYDAEISRGVYKR